MSVNLAFIQLLNAAQVCILFRFFTPLLLTFRLSGATLKVKSERERCFYCVFCQKQAAMLPLLTRSPPLGSSPMSDQSLICGVFLAEAGDDL
jgi:hypothetical protein